MIQLERTRYVVTPCLEAFLIIPNSRLITGVHFVIVLRSLCILIRFPALKPGFESGGGGFFIYIRKRISNDGIKTVRGVERSVSTADRIAGR